MNITSIESVLFSDIEWSSYNLILCASGFEARSSHIIRSMPQDVYAKTYVFGFSSEFKTLSREDNDELFYKLLNRDIFIASDHVSVESEICRLLSNSGKLASKLRVFIDYSAMSRDWYGYILTWAKYQNICNAVELDFGYSHGSYAAAFGPLRIKEILCVPGFEGSGAGSRITTAFFGLGFDSAATLTVNDLIEPDRAICFLARSSTTDPHADKVLEENAEMVRDARSKVLELPLTDVRRAVSSLLERISTENEESGEVLLVPMGPKTHVLACLLACHVSPKIACMHAKGTRAHPVQVSANGPISVARVIYS